MVLGRDQDTLGAVASSNEKKKQFLLIRFSWQQMQKDNDVLQDKYASKHLRSYRKYNILLN